jgi:hypothetical protein
MQDDKQTALDARVAGVMAEDDISEALTVVERYPQLEDRGLSHFERDFRDWGLIYGIAFGIAKAEQGDEPNELVADRAYKVARSRFAVWNGGDIEDPEVVRERGVRLVISEFEKAQQRALQGGPLHQDRGDDDRRSAQRVGEFEIVMGGMPA